MKNEFWFWTAITATDIGAATCMMGGILNLITISIEDQAKKDHASNIAAVMFFSGLLLATTGLVISNKTMKTMFTRNP